MSRMTKTLEFLFDFGSPNAYLSHKVLPALAERTGAKLVYTPVLLGGLFKSTGNQAPMVAFAGVPKKLAYESLETRRFIARHGLTAFRMNPHFPVNTLMLMRGATAAEAAGQLMPYVEAGFTAMWEKGAKMDDPAVFRAELAAAGLPADALIASSQTPEIKQKLLERTEAAAARGAFGSPTFFVGDEMWFGKERLREIEDYLAA